MQLEDYGTRLVVNLLRGRGELATVFGHDSIESDFSFQQTHQRVLETYQLLNQDTRDLCEGFAAGTNRYVAAHPDQFAGWTLDLSARQLRREDDVVVILSSGEFRLLKALLERPNRVLSRDQLLSLTQGREAEPFDRSIDLHISRLRQKLGDDARSPQLIKTLRNEGYMLCTTVTQPA